MDKQSVLAPHYNSERSETIRIVANELIGTGRSKLSPALARLMEGKWKKGAIPPKWEGNPPERIARQLEQLLPGD